MVGELGSALGVLGPSDEHRVNSSAEKLIFGGEVVGESVGLEEHGVDGWLSENMAPEGGELAGAVEKVVSDLVSGKSIVAAAARFDSTLNEAKIMGGCEVLLSLGPEGKLITFGLLSGVLEFDELLSVLEVEESGDGGPEVVGVSESEASEGLHVLVSSHDGEDVSGNLSIGGGKSVLLL